MPQPQPSTPDVVRIVGLVLTALGVICVLLFLGGLLCNVSQIMNPNPDLEVGFNCTNMLSQGFLGAVVVMILKAFLTLFKR
jgi:hypothetical protein